MAEQINLSAIPADEAAASAVAATPYVQAALTDPETKKVFEALILAIRQQLSPNMSGVFNYKANTNSQQATDPGAGKVRWNTVNQQAATELYFDWITDDGFDPVLYFKLIVAPQKFALQDKNLHSNYQIWTIAAPVIEMPDWFIVPVMLDSFGGAGVMANNAQVSVLL